MTDILEQLAILRAENARLLAESEEQELRPAARKQAGTRQARTISKPWLAVVYNSDGTIAMNVDPKGKIRELTKGFDRSGDADKWVFLRLNEAKPGSYAEITCSFGRVCERITRDEALGRMIGHRRVPVTHSNNYRPGRLLGFGVKVHQTRVEFSRG